MSDNALLHFEDLHLTFGHTIQILPKPSSPGERFESVLLGCLRGETVMVTPPPSGKFPLLSEGQQVVIRVSTLNGVALFPTLVLHIAQVPLYILYLDFPKAINFKQIRQATRVEVAMPVLVSNLNNAAYRSVAGRVSDISLGGAKLDFNQLIGNKGDEIELKGKFEIASIKRILSVRAKIRTVVHSAGVHQYGVQFFEQDEDKQLVLFGFIYSAMAIGTPKIIE
ncbi:flagellar protein YcgR [Alteromonadaceae bacterium 2753L.S.0a.02]|nr:flagellar protein YcgR [Alteromonadaceae bacterium 2753L.S.0a.02]